MTIIFSNPGELDLRALTTFGLSAKEGDSPIGEFGTGLKMALAVLAREGAEVELVVGSNKWMLATRGEIVRGKEFEFLYLESNGFQPDVELSCTTELARNWELWMAYRELWSNCMDEGGQVVDYSSLAGEVIGHTAISVSLPEFSEIHASRGNYILASEPLWSSDLVEIHSRGETGLFYRGIRVGRGELVPGKRTLFAYNLLSKFKLTEDRTLAELYTAQMQVAKAILGCEDEEILRGILLAVDSIGEENLDFDWDSTPPGESFVRVAFTRLMSEEKLDLNPSVGNALSKRYKGRYEKRKAPPIPETWEGMVSNEPELNRARVDNYQLYSVIAEYDRRLAQATKRGDYWKACAEVLAQEAEHRGEELFSNVTPELSTFVGDLNSELDDEIPY